MSATLANVDLTDAAVGGASFWGATASGFTKEQLYSTVSYRYHDLSGVELAYNDLTGWNFTGQNLTNADFHLSQLIDARLSQANLNGASLWSSRLINAHLTEANLTNADFFRARLSNADLTDAVVGGASFHQTTCPEWGTGEPGFTKEQLYSTASYKNHDLSGIGLGGNDLTGWNFAGQNLTSANFNYAVLTDADFRGADTRGAMDLSDPAIGTAILGNTILPDGRIEGLDLTTGQTLVVRDYDGNPAPWIDPPIGKTPIRVEDHYMMEPGGVLQIVVEADAWDSTISFEPGIPVTLAGGTLELRLAAGVDPASQIGRTLHVFDWTGVVAVGEFNVVSPYVWDLSLYTMGEVTFVAIPEPACLALLLVGVSSMALFQWRQLP